MKTTVAIIGAGPAGLTAGYLLSKNEVESPSWKPIRFTSAGFPARRLTKVFISTSAATVSSPNRKRSRICGRRFCLTTCCVRPRSSRIFYGGKFFAYPLKPFEALIKLGVFRSVLCVLSWLKARLFPVRDPRNFEEWVSNQFGKRLFNTFFKSYTEKVWGMSCKEISADWAAQRIKGLSLGSAIKNALIPAALQRRPHKGDQDADQFLPLSAQRPRHDVGSVRGKDEGAWAARSRWAAK